MNDEMSMECVIKIRQELKISDRRGHRRDGIRRKEKPQSFLRGGAGPTRNKRRIRNSASITPYSRCRTQGHGSRLRPVSYSQVEECVRGVRILMASPDMQVPMYAYKYSVSVWLLEVGARHAVSLLSSLSRLILITYLNLITSTSIY
ncbi:hypothetical protein J6590_074003 [Homalodisca vitripennis]|nr:hypothetical protein J6590_074003 [Homalodisca vitripennis]